MFEKKYLFDLINRYPTIDLNGNSEIKHLTVVPSSHDLIKLQEGDYHILTDFFAIEKDNANTTEIEIGISIDNSEVANIALPFGRTLDEHIQCIWYILYQPLFRAVNKGKRIYQFISLQTKYDLLDLLTFFYEEKDKEIEEEMKSIDFDNFDDYDYNI